MPKPEADNMKADIQIRALVDRRTQGVLDKWADEEHRSGQQQNGILLRKLCELYEQHPDVLVDLGMIPRRTPAKVA